MENKFPSAYERMMQELKANGQVSVLDNKTTYRIQQEVNEHMDTFNAEKQRRAAQSEKHAATVVLTA